MSYSVIIQPAALKMLTQITDRRIREKIIEHIDGLTENPNKQGKPLAAELDGFRSLRAVGQRYRIIYKVDGDQVIVIVVAVGIRKEGDKKDIYRLAKRLVRLGLLENEAETSEPDAPEPSTQEHEAEDKSTS